MVSLSQHKEEENNPTSLLLFSCFHGLSVCFIALLSNFRMTEVWDSLNSANWDTPKSKPKAHSLSLLLIFWTCGHFTKIKQSNRNTFMPSESNKFVHLPLPHACATTSGLAMACWEEKIPVGWKSEERRERATGEQG